jgi:hypothetical protein
MHILPAPHDEAFAAPEQRPELPEDVQGGGPLLHPGQVVVAHQQEHREAGLQQAPEAGGELPQIGRGGIPVFKGVAAEQDQVRLVLDGIVHDAIEGMQEVHHPPVQAGLGVDLAVGLHADMQIGEMKDANGLGCHKWSRRAGSSRKF